MDTNGHEQEKPAPDLMPWEPVEDLEYLPITHAGMPWVEGGAPYKCTVIGNNLHNANGPARIMLAIQTNGGPKADVLFALAVLTGLLNPSMTEECEYLLKQNGELGRALKDQTVLLWALCKSNSMDGSMHINRKYVIAAPADGRLVKTVEELTGNIILKAEDGPGLIVL